MGIVIINPRYNRISLNMLAQNELNNYELSISNYDKKEYRICYIMELRSMRFLINYYNDLFEKNKNRKEKENGKVLYYNSNTIC